VAGPALALPARPGVPTVVVHVGCDGRLGSIPAAQNAAPRPSIGFATALETSFSRGGRQPTGERPSQTAVSIPSEQLVTNATNALQTMQSSAYVHTSLRYPVVDATYRTDCSGFASFLVNQVSPGTATDPFPALADLVRLGGKASADAGSGSSQPRAYANQFEEVFGALGAGVTDRFWRPVVNPRDLQPGDFVSWLLPPSSSDRDTGHVMLAATAATLGPPRTFTATTCATTGTAGAPRPTTGPAPNYGYDCNGTRISYYEYDLTVIDSSGPHGPLAAPALNKTPVSQIVAGADSRNGNPLNHPSANGGRVTHSGIGEGQIGLLTLTPDGPRWPSSGTRMTRPPRNSTMPPPPRAGRRRRRRAPRVSPAPAPPTRSPCSPEPIAAVSPASPSGGSPPRHELTGRVLSPSIPACSIAATSARERTRWQSMSRWRS
jgi:hypothetical protein